MAKEFEKSVANEKPEAGGGKIGTKTPWEAGALKKEASKKKKGTEKKKAPRRKKDKINLLSGGHFKELRKTDSLLVEKIHDISDQLSLTLAERKRLEDSLSSTKSVLGEVRKERERFKARVELLEGASETLDEIRERVVPKEEEITDVFSIIKDLEHQLDFMFKVKGELEKELDATRARLDESESNNESLASKVKELTAETAVVGDLREEVAFTGEELNNALERTRELEGELKSTLEEMENAYTKLESSGRTNEQLKEEINNLQTELERTMEERDILTEKLGDAERSISELSSENERLEEAVKAREKHIAELEKAEKQLEGEREKLLQKIASLEARLENTLVIKNALETELVASKEAMGEIRTALSGARAVTKKRYYRSAENRK
ncbi:MAG: hypothetical protein AB1742_07160 [bacterium]